MKKQHTVLYVYDQHGNVATFERFAVKTAKGVINQYRHMLESVCSSMMEWYLTPYRNASHIDIYATSPDGTPTEFITQLTADNFIQAIGATRSA